MSREDEIRLSELEKLRDDDTYAWTQEEEDEYYFLVGLVQEETERNFLMEAQW